MLTLIFGFQESQEFCVSDIIYGCTDDSQYNYDELANTDDGSCVPFIYGCGADSQYNYDDWLILMIVVFLLFMDAQIPMREIIMLVLTMMMVVVILHCFLAIFHQWLICR